MPTLTLLYVLFAITIVIALILFVGILGIVRLNNWLICFARRLKGSRVTYYIDESGFVRSTTKKLRTPADRVGTNMKPNNQSVIEINQGWFRLSSSIYGDFHIGPWKIAKASKDCNAQGGFGADWVDLVDCSSLPVERALYLINKQPSLQALMLENGNQRNRIAELEKECKLANTRRLELRAVVRALLEIINADRQKYRSQAAQHIRVFLEEVESQATKMNEPNPSRDQIESWKKVAAVGI